MGNITINGYSDTSNFHGREGVVVIDVLFLHQSQCTSYLWLSYGEKIPNPLDSYLWKHPFFLWGPSIPFFAITSLSAQYFSTLLYRWSSTSPKYQVWSYIPLYSTLSGFELFYTKIPTPPSSDIPCLSLLVFFDLYNEHKLFVSTTAIPLLFWVQT